MPGPEVHTYVDRLLFGRSYWRIHREMDRPYKILGKYHRVLFHDPILAYVIANRQYPNDANAIAAAQCHIALDNMCSRDKGLKRTLERLARLDRKKRKSTKATSGTSRLNAIDSSSGRLRPFIDLPDEAMTPWIDPVLAELRRILLGARGQ
jgi:hypothetical protein